MGKLEKVRMNTDVTMSVSIVDSGVAIHTDNMSCIFAGLYSERQKVLVARCEYTPAEDRLIIKSPANNQRFEGEHRLVISLTIGGRKAAYDAMAFDVVRWTEDVVPAQTLAEESEPIGVHISIHELSSSVVYEIIEAAIAATDEATRAAERVNNIADIHKGEKGDTGPVGPQGPQGPQGEPGPAYDDTELKKDINTKLSGKVDKVEGKGLSTYDFNSAWVDIIERSGNDPFRVAWEDLISMRDNGELIAGRLYRITDYVTTTAQENTRSAGHQFDIIVLALDNKTLSEEAYAAIHEGDTYFTEAGANLSAWKIWYCLDNDRERFAWADAENGKGVIYRMIDEWNNDVPYDFKNIQFKRNLNFDNGYAEYSDDGDETWVYTFAGQSYHINNDEYSEMLDGSLESPFGHMSDEESHTFHDNIIKPYINVYDEVDELRENCGLRYLNNIVFLGYWEEIGSTNDEDMPYYYAYCCNSNSFGNDCYSNSFGNYCKSNSFGNYCKSNSFGNDCNNNSFGNDCNSNSFGNNCNKNSFGNYCYSNSFGNDCYSNSFGNDCNNNSLGNYCDSNSFGNYCNKNSFKDMDGIADKVRYNKLDDGVHNMELYHENTKGDYSDLKNYHVCRGVRNVTVDIFDDRNYETTFAMTPSGALREFVIAELNAS